MREVGTFHHIIQRFNLHSIEDMLTYFDMYSEFRRDVLCPTQPCLNLIQDLGGDVLTLREAHADLHPERAIKRLESVLRNRALMMGYLKAWAVLNLLGSADAQATQIETLSERLSGIYINWFNCICMMLYSVAQFMEELASVSVVNVSRMGDEIGGQLAALNDTALAIILPLLLIYLALAGFRMIREVGSWAREITTTVSYNLNVFRKTPVLRHADEVINLESIERAVVLSVSKRADNFRVYDVKIADKIYKIPESVETKTPILEMSMPGSTLYPSAHKPGIVVLMLRNDCDTFDLVGLGCRLGDYLVTAAHVANVIYSGVYQPVLATFTGGLDPTVNMKRIVSMSRDSFDLDEGPQFGNQDIFAVKLDKGIWSKLGVTSISCAKASRFNQLVSSVGVQNSKLVSAVGKTLNTSTVYLLDHTATTNRGFSGGPVFSGKHMIGLHVGTNGDSNQAVRIEVIKRGLSITEEFTSDFVRDEVRGDYKVNGKSGTYVDDDGYMGPIFYANDGTMYDIPAHILQEMQDYENQRRRDEREYDYHYDDDDVQERDSRKWEDDVIANDPYGDDPVRGPRGMTTANALIAKRKKQRPSLRGYKESAPCANVQRLGVNPNLFIEMDAGKPIHVMKYPEASEISIDLIEQSMSSLVKAGYDPDQYGEPNINCNSEEVSLLKGLCLFEDRVNTVKAPPTLDEKTRLRFLLEDLLKHNKYFPNKDYKSRQNFSNIINSSLVNCSKSAGFPYVSDATPTNGDVLKSMEEPGLIDTVLREWNEPFELRWFLKAEPHKRAKIEKKMLRGVMGMPLHKMIKHQSLFRELNNQAVKAWRKSPIAYGFSPLVPGDVENVWRRFQRNILETDKSNWDLNMFGYLYDICKDVICDLAVQPDGMSDSDFALYLDDVRNAIDEIGSDSVFRCSNGHRYKLNVKGVMKSGCVLTILLNSLSQLVLHLLVSFRMGYSDEEIKSPTMNIIVGGDDVLQCVPDGFDVSRCLEEYAKLGVVVTDYKLHPTMEGAEYFSNKFSSRDGVVVFEPCRFTKHIYSLRTTKPEFLSQALVSHMANYCWSSKYMVFDAMFRWLRNNHPNLVQNDLYRTQFYWRHKSKGYECL
jgi:hypothetical protein